MATYHLHRWSVSYEETASPYAAPEQLSPRLVGFRDNEKKSVVTSPIVQVDGKQITTRSGSLYILEDIDPDYLTWLNDNGYVYNSENPISFKD